jgi:hypothetical protein
MFQSHYELYFKINNFIHFSRFRRLSRAIAPVWKKTEQRGS